jgi:hypothetical protein
VPGERVVIEELRPRYCRHPACWNEGYIVVVAVSPTDFGPDPEPTDAITSLSLVCDDHAVEPWIEVSRLERRGVPG